MAPPAPPRSPTAQSAGPSSSCSLRVVVRGHSVADGGERITYRPDESFANQRSTYLIAFVLRGLPRFVVSLGVPLAGVLAVAVVGGFAVGFINPILGAVIYERIPTHLVGRVTALQNSLCWAGIPFGSLIGGALVATIGLDPALVTIGAAYFVATMLPALQPQWREMDRRKRAEVG